MKKVCSIKGCSKPSRAKGICAAHYHQQRRAEVKKSKSEVEKTEARLERLERRVEALEARL